jgi:DNA-binding response OmpR family regulator
VMFVSGYTDDVLGSEVSRGKGMDFLQKPFSPAALLQRVRKLLDQP